MRQSGGSIGPCDSVIEFLNAAPMGRAKLHAASPGKQLRRNSNYKFAIYRSGGDEFTLFDNGLWLKKSKIGCHPNTSGQWDIWVFPLSVEPAQAPGNLQDDNPLIPESSVTDRP